MALAHKKLRRSLMVEVLRDEIEVVRELAEEEEVYRWAILCMASLLHHLSQTADQGDTGWLSECRAFYERLVDIDPDHIHRYKAILAQLPPL